jgi:hypothetical protein
MGKTLGGGDDDSADDRESHLPVGDTREEPFEIRSIL